MEYIQVFHISKIHIMLVLLKFVLLICYSYYHLIRIVVQVGGIEPPMLWLKVTCHTTWLHLHETGSGLPLTPTWRRFSVLVPRLEFNRPSPCCNLLSCSSFRGQGCTRLAAWCRTLPDYTQENLVPMVGFEPTRFRPQILSLLCLPFHHTGVIWERCPERKVCEYLAARSLQS